MTISRIRPVRSVLTLLGFAWVLTGCAAVDEAKDGNKAGRGADGCGKKAVLCKSEYGKKWPLTVDKVVVSCTGSDGVGMVFAEADETRYAVNGLAIGQNKAMPKIDKIWARNPSNPGTKINISPIIEAGLKSCKYPLPPWVRPIAIDIVSPPLAGSGLRHTTALQCLVPGSVSRHSSSPIRRT